MTTKTLDLTDKRRWVITSVIRIIIPIVLTYVGLELAPDQVGEVATGMGLAVWVLFSITMSVSGRSKLLETKPPYVSMHAGRTR